MRLLPSDPDIETLIGRIEKGDIDLQPDFQRGEVWSLAKRQRLIDSILRDWHIPPVHVILDDLDEKVAVLDGQQRLAAIRDFARGEFSVDGDIEPLDGSISKLDGMVFFDLPPEVRRKFLRFSVRLFTIVDFKPSEPGELFYRLNQLSSLTAAEQRNAFFGVARRQVKDLAKHVERLNLSGGVFGFSNARMAYDDVLTRALFLLDSGTLRQKTTSSVLADRYRSDFDFSDRAVYGVRSALDVMALAQDASESAIRLNKATAQTWLVFLASATERFFVPENRAGFLSDFMVRFEFTRSAFVKSAIAEDLFSKDAPHLQSMAQERFLFRALRTYDDRATSRVADVSSVVLRDMVLWAFMFVMAPNGRYLGEPDDAHSILFSLLKAPDDGLKGASLEVLADHLGWGASI